MTSKIDEVLEQAVVDGLIVEWNHNAELGSIECKFRDRTNRKAFGKYATDPDQLKRWLEGNAFEVSLKRWRVTKEVIKRKAFKKYGFKARKWFA